MRPNEQPVWHLTPQHSTQLPAPAVPEKPFDVDSFEPASAHTPGVFNLASVLVHHAQNKMLERPQAYGSLLSQGRTVAAAALQGHAFALLEPAFTVACTCSS